ncbi:DNA topoisomerase IB [Chitinophaga lutea]
MEEKLSMDKAAAAVRLRYVSASMPGLRRIRTKSGFTYEDQHGHPVTDEAVLQRIKSLVLPPAWEDVWICPYANGHLQATGKDTRGRRQYRYHPRWAAARNETKYARLRAFGRVLPRIRRQIARDLRRRQLDKPRVIAIALRVMEETLMRVGNEEYRRQYHSYGLTTLRNNHVRINGNEVFFRFSGKKGVEQKIHLRHASMARLLKKMRDMPGQELFQYYEDGEIRSLDSGEVNEYLKTITNEEFTCKDFRTWAGTLHALRLLAEAGPFASEAECKRNIVSVIDQVAARLGNTRAVCKKYYIHPLLFELYEKGRLGELSGAPADEKTLLKLLR